MVISVYAPDSSMDFGEYERFMQGLTKVMLEGRRRGARRPSSAGDPDTEPGPPRTDEDKENAGDIRTAVLAWKTLTPDQENDVAESDERVQSQGSFCPVEL